jgi:hypothetical protein
MIPLTIEDFEGANGSNRDMILVSPNPAGKQRIQNDFTLLLNEALEKILLTTNGVKPTLFITDPYLFSWRGNAGGWYELFLANILKPLYPKTAKIIALVKDYNLDLVDYFKTHALANGGELQAFECHQYHDRIWLSSNPVKATYVGGSLTNIGSKYVFVNPLPDEDAKLAFSLVEKFLHPALHIKVRLSEI